ncbi:MAG: hypothetical protein JNM37_14155 [Rhodocyclaceae bacterium]|nr:hypothetical protein [Rhodocyclaceae bacterium]
MAKNAIAVKSAHTPGSLGDIRAQIADLQAKIAEVEAAPLPLDMIEDAFRRSFGDLIAPKNDVLARLASGFAHSTDRVPSPIPGAETPEAIAKLALALALDKAGDLLIQQARQTAEIDDLTTGRARLDPLEKAERLAELHAQLYALEIAEEAIVTATAGTERRPDANAGAVLGVPADVAARHRYFVEA